MHQHPQHQQYQHPEQQYQTEVPPIGYSVPAVMSNPFGAIDVLEMYRQQVWMNGLYKIDEIEFQRNNAIDRSRMSPITSTRRKRKRPTTPAMNIMS